MAESLREDEIQGQIVHIYDGIEEADNELPRWWLVTFFGACIFSVFYWMFHESFAVMDYPNEAYTKARLAALESAGPVTDDDLISLSQDGPMVAAGKATFMSACSKCHGTSLEGKEGPNLTDEFWIHGGAPKDIYDTIFNGTKKGMPAWGPKLGGGSVKQVTAFILTQRNTNVPGKEPQGPKWDPEAAAE